MAAGDLVGMRVKMEHLFWIAEVNLGFRLKDDTAEALPALAAEWYGTIAHTWMTPVCNTVHIVELQLDSVEPSGADPLIVEPPEALYGEQAAEVAPHSCAALLRWTTGLQGIGNRGRSFLYGFRADQIQYGQFWGEDAKAAMANIGAAMMLRFGPTGFSPVAEFVLINRQRNNAPLVPFEATPVNGFLPVELLASQRRRIYNVPE